MDLPHHDRPEHINSAFISLSFLQNLGFCQKKKKKKKKKKKSDETVKNPYFLVVLVNNIITF
jgi:hypothetical protein